MHDAKNGSRLRGDGGIRGLENLGSLVRDRKVQDNVDHVLHHTHALKQQAPLMSTINC